MLSEMRWGRLTPNVISYSAALSDCERGKGWKTRHEFLEPDVFSYTATMSARKKCEHWELALRMLTEMRQGQLEPNVINYSAAISTSDSGEQWERALDMLSEMRQWQLKPNEVSYGAAISACEQGEQWGHGWGGDMAGAKRLGACCRRKETCMYICFYIYIYIYIKREFCRKYVGRMYKIPYTPHSQRFSGSYLIASRIPPGLGPWPTRGPKMAPR